ncbi:hypothetical protein [Carboxylicivirga sp. M1479]|uniref:hypothetical protein n=1 Tax=Carboxylicivirga sp. M1479 TaxID=2594476 RepID=UPI0011779D2A|nr:hypothetical protein [Carboxylicivirga sp. M1479]TRX71948.1 hypothetical protein FNN09_04825 [Carboxylicivirga sp. M1479]
MKIVLINSILLLAFSTFTYSQVENDTIKSNDLIRAEWHDEAGNAYLTLNLINGIPIADFSSRYSKKNLWGFGTDLVISPIISALFWQPGIQYQYYHGGKDWADWHGLELATSVHFHQLNFINRFRFASRKKFSPYLEIGMGKTWSKARSWYTIVDEATFFEQLFFNAEDEVETHQMKKYTDNVSNLSLGVGFMLYNWVNIQIKYVSSQEITYVQKGDIRVSAPDITYINSNSTIEMIVLSLGVSTELLYRY